MTATITVTQITITKVTYKGSNRISFNVDFNGRPFGQIWTFKASDEIHPFHVKTLDGFYATAKTYPEAERLIRGEM
jgi:hypothetical protein